MTIVQLQPVDFDEGWSCMETGITKLKNILDGQSEAQFSSQEYIKLYTMIYNMCTQKPPHDYSELLYAKYKECFVQHITCTVIPSLSDKHGVYLLRELVKAWNNHKLMVKWLTRFFNYLDRYFVGRRSLTSLKEVGLTAFRDLVYQDMRLKARDVVITLIDEEREGQQIERTLIKDAVDMSVEIGSGEMDNYEKDFEDAILSDTAAYYKRKASKWIAEDSTPDYMLKAEDSLEKEKARVTHYLHSSTETKLLEKVQHELLVVHTNQLLENEDSGCGALLIQDKVEDLSRMYKLFNLIPNGLEYVANTFKKHVTSKGMLLLQQAEDASTNKEENAGPPEQILVMKLIELHDKYFSYVTGCFCNNSLFHKALKDAFVAFCNKNVGSSSIAELFASFCDIFLKKGSSEKLGDEAIEETMDKVLSLFVHVNDKDLFAEYYRKKLSRRLLFDKSCNDEHERLLLTKLKQLCGGPFTSKMEGMVTDVTLAKENQSLFQEYLSNNPNVNPGLEFTVTVLTTGYWPSYKSSDFILPAEMAKCIEVFKEFYQTKAKHRKLTWIFSLGTCHLNGKFEQKTIELTLGTYQAAVLLLFNNDEKLSYSDIKAQLNLGDDDLVRLLHSLSCAKYKILNKEPKSKSISSDDSFEFNSGFTDKMRRIRVPLPPLDDRKKIAEDVDKDRRFAIDAALVRIMKSRKVLGHQQLIMECVEQLSKMFKPEVKAIKKRIEDLIAREYLERDKYTPNTFNYLA